MSVVVDVGADPILMELIIKVLKSGGIFTVEELLEKLDRYSLVEIKGSILALAKLGKVKLWVGIPYHERLLVG